MYQVVISETNLRYVFFHSLSGIKGRFYSTQYGSSFSLMFKEGNVRGQPPSPGSVGSHYEWQIIHIPGNNGSENTISIWMTSSNQWVKYNARNSPLQMVSEQNTKEFNDSTTFWLRPNIWGNYPYSYALEALTEPGYFISTVAGSNLHLYQHSSSDPHVVWYILGMKKIYFFLYSGCVFLFRLLDVCFYFLFLHSGCVFLFLLLVFWMCVFISSACVLDVCFYFFFLYSGCVFLFLLLDVCFYFLFLHSGCVFLFLVLVFWVCVLISSCILLVFWMSSNF